MSDAHIHPIYTDSGLRLTFVLQAMALLCAGLVVRTPHMPLIWGVLFISAYAFGLFERAVCANPYKHFVRTCAVAMCVSVLAFFIQANSYSAVIALLLPPMVCAIGRVIFGRQVFKRRVLALGSHDPQQWLVTLSAQDYYSPVIFNADELQAQHPQASLYQLCQQYQMREIVATIAPSPQQAQQLLQCANHGIRVFKLPQFVEREIGRIEPYNLYDTDFIFCGDNAVHRHTQALKRGLDIVCALLIGILLAPLLLLGMVLIKLDDGAPLFYAQQRVGRYGKIFTIYKLRTMRRDAEAGGAQWAQQGDNRITRVGKFLRQSRIDEIPQLWCILRGDMSLVGPRPERPEFTQALSATIPHYDDRHSVRPGLTGWAQLCMRYTSTHDETTHKLAYDLYYIKNLSLWFDMAIMLKTVRVLLFTDNAR